MNSSILLVIGCLLIAILVAILVFYVLLGIGMFGGSGVSASPDCVIVDGRLTNPKFQGLRDPVERGDVKRPTCKYMLRRKPKSKFDRFTSLGKRDQWKKAG